MVSWNDARMELREIRSSQARNSARTSSLAITVISANRGSDLGEERTKLIPPSIILIPSSEIAMIRVVY